MPDHHLPRSTAMLSGAIAALLCASPVATMAAPAPSSAFLEFTNAPPPGKPLDEVPHLRMGVEGSLVSAVMDTGSTGVVISATSIPDIDRLPSLGAGSITYSSSGRIMNGHWVVTPLVIAGRSGVVRTRPIAVLAVDAIACTPTARRCTPDAHPTHVAMLGIGFGRRHDKQPGGTPDRNPLLNLAGGGARRYVITRRGIAIGAGRDGFTTVTLTPDPTTPGDWATPPACIALDAGPPACGTVLVDTGIIGMFLTLPPERLPSGAEAAKTLPAGTTVSIALVPGEAGAAVRHVVRVGDGGDAGAPASVILAGIGKRPTFVNTGARLLNRFDYLYDADAGLVGYRAVGGP